MSGPRVAVLGAGRMGGALARGLERAGCDVRVGVRDPSAARPGGTVRSVEEAARGASVVFLAVPAEAVPDVLAHAGPLRGVVLVDLVNVPRGAASHAAALAATRPQARVVKAFNTISHRTLASPGPERARTTVLLASDDGGALRRVAALARAMGFAAVRAGPLAAAADVEAMGRLGMSIARVNRTPDVTFRVCRRRAAGA